MGVTMGLYRSRLLVAGTALVVLALPALAQDKPDKPDEKQIVKKQSQFASYDDDKKSVTLKDGTTWPIDPDLPAAARHKIDELVYTLEAPADIVIELRDGLIISITKGKAADPTDLMPPEMKKSIKDTKVDDEVIIAIAAGRVIAGTVDKIDANGIRIHPALDSKGVPTPTDHIKRKYSRATETFAFGVIKKFDNVTQINGPQKADDPLAAQDAVAKQDLRVGDTIRIGFITGQIAELTDATLKLREWKGGVWGDTRDFDRANLPEVKSAEIKLRRSYPVNGTGEVVLEEERFRLAKSNLLALKGAIWHDQKESILAGATLVFAAGPQGTNFSISPATKDEIAVPPVFADERWLEEKRNDQEDGQVTLNFDPAKNLIPVTSPEAKAYILIGLATKIDLTALSRVYAAAAKNGDPELAFILAVRYAQAPAGPDQERAQALIVEALQKFGEKGAQALLDAVMGSDNVFRIPDASDNGNVVWKDQKEQASAWKKHLIKLLAYIPGAASGDRGRKLFALLEDRGAEFSDPIMKLFSARTSETIDALLEVAIALNGKLTQDEVKRVEDATGVIRNLGDKALDDLIQRVKAQGQRGSIEAGLLNSMRRKTPPAPPGEIIDSALHTLITWRMDERREQLRQRLDEARARKAEKKWEEALAIVEDVIHQDRDNDDAKKLLYECLVQVADLRLAKHERGEAARLLHQMISDGAVNKGAEGRLGKILLESVREDLDKNCVRREADPGSEVVAEAKKGDILMAAPVKHGVDNWFPVKDKAGGIAWIEANLITQVDAGAKCIIAGTSMKPIFIRNKLKDVTRYAPELGPSADGIEGELAIRDAVEKEENGDNAAAYQLYRRARELVPNDPRLGAMWKCWVKANGLLLAIFVGALVLVAIFVGAMLMRRQKRVRVAEFHFYGKDRARAERELDGGTKAAAPEDGGVPVPSGEPGSEPPAAPPS
jgi:tetratricopeptide (TPR) repeat protein